jgi:hypothetical protein
MHGMHMIKMRRISRALPRSLLQEFLPALEIDCSVKSHGLALNEANPNPARVPGTMNTSHPPRAE